MKKEPCWGLTCAVGEVVFVATVEEYQQMLAECISLVSHRPPNFSEAHNIFGVTKEIWEKWHSGDEEIYLVSNCIKYPNVMPMYDNYDPQGLEDYICEATEKSTYTLIASIGQSKHEAWTAEAMKLFLDESFV